MTLTYWKCKNCGVYLPDEKLSRDHHQYWKHGRKPTNNSKNSELEERWEEVKFNEVKVALKSLLDEDISDLEFSDEEIDEEDDQGLELQSEEESDVYTAGEIDKEKDEEFELQSEEESDISTADISKKSFKCRLCSSETKYANNFARHMLNVHGIKTKPPIRNPGIKCPSCSFRTKSKVVLAKHVKTHELEKNDEPEEIPTTNIIFEKGQEFKCYDCPATFPTQKQLYLHREKDHTEEKPFECPHCPGEIAFKKETYYKIHMLRHSDRWEFLKKNPELLKAEKKKIINERTKFRLAIYNRPLNFKCPHCSRAFYSRSHLQNHVNKHNKERPFKCPTCGASYRVKHSLDEHIRLGKCEQVIAETAGKLMSCDICFLRLKNEKSVTSHKRTQHGIRIPRKPPAVNCPFCSYRARGSTTLERHMKIHTEEKEFPCEACGSRFTFRSNMIAHVRKCDLARKSGLAAKYPQKRTRCKSSKSYQGDLVKCPECGEQYSSWRLNGHLTIHGTEFKCPHCPAGYQKKMGLAFHIKRTHPEKESGEECESCGKKFGSWCRLRVHCQLVHGVQIGSRTGRRRKPPKKILPLKLKKPPHSDSESDEDFLEDEKESTDVKLEMKSDNEQTEVQNILDEMGHPPKSNMENLGDESEVDSLEEEDFILVKMEEEISD